MNLEHLAFKLSPHFFFEFCIRKNNSSTFVVILLILEIFCPSIFSLVSAFFLLLLLLNHFHCCSFAFTHFSSLHLQSTLFFLISFSSVSVSVLFPYFFPISSPDVFAYCVYILLYIHPPHHCEQEQKLCLLWGKQYEYLKRQISKSASKLSCT